MLPRHVLMLIAAVALVAAAPPRVTPEVNALFDRAEAALRAGSEANARALTRQGLDRARATHDEAGEAEALVRIAAMTDFSDADSLAAGLAPALAIQVRIFGDHSYQAELTRNQIILFRALAGDRIAQLPALAASARTLARLAATPAQREETAVMLLTAAQFATSAGETALAQATMTEGIAMLARPDTQQKLTAAQAYDIAYDVNYRWGRYDEALRWATRAATTLEKAEGLRHPYLSRSLGNMGDALMRLGRYGEAEPLLRRSLAVADASDPPEPPLLLLALERLGDFYRDTGRAALAEPLYRRALAIGEALPSGFRYALAVYLDLAEIHRARGELAEARNFVAAADTKAAASIGAASVERGGILLRLAALDAALGLHDRAEDEARTATAIYTAQLGKEDPRRGDALAMTAQIAAGRGDARIAAADYQAAVAAMTGRAPGERSVVEARVAGAVALVAAGDGSERPWRLAREAADALTSRLVDRSALAGRDAALDTADRSVFDRSVEVAWARATTLGPPTAP